MRKWKVIAPGTMFEGQVFEGELYARGIRLKVIQDGYDILKEYVPPLVVKWMWFGESEVVEVTDGT